MSYNQEYNERQGVGMRVGLAWEITVPERLWPQGTDNTMPDLCAGVSLSQPSGFYLRWHLLQEKSLPFL